LGTSHDAAQAFGAFSNRNPLDFIKADIITAPQGK
jgi:hypothetical protein